MHKYNKFICYRIFYSASCPWLLVYAWRIGKTLYMSRICAQVFIRLGLGIIQDSKRRTGQCAEFLRAESVLQGTYDIVFIWLFQISSKLDGELDNRELFPRIYALKVCLLFYFLIFFIAKILKILKILKIPQSFYWYVFKNISPDSSPYYFFLQFTS